MQDYDKVKLKKKKKRHVHDYDKVMINLLQFIKQKGINLLFKRHGIWLIIYN